MKLSICEASTSENECECDVRSESEERGPGRSAWAKVLESMDAVSSSSTRLRAVDFDLLVVIDGGGKRN